MTETADTARACAAAMWSQDLASQGLGIEVSVVRAGEASATMTVREQMLNGFGVLHGGLSFALADTAFAFACNGYDEQSFAASAQVEFLRPARLGDVLTATAREDYRGRRNGYYSVTVSNQRDEVIVLFRGRSQSNGQAVTK